MKNLRTDEITVIAGTPDKHNWAGCSEYFTGISIIFVICGKLLASYLGKCTHDY